MFAFKINRGLRDYKAAAGAVLLDVRTEEEYLAGHIPDSVNLPLQQLDKIASVVDNKGAPLLVYCLSGARSRRAASMLRRMGYKNAKNIGGIAAYSGKVVK